MEIIDNGAIIGLLKFFSHKEYAEDLLNGKLYCHESGWFRKLDDKYRGDQYDGKMPLNVDGMLVEWGPIRCISSGVAVKGFNNDNKLPIYCLSVIDIKILDKVSGTSYILKPTFVEKMKQFGTYLAILNNYSEFLRIVTSHADTKQLAASHFRVEYSNIMNEYDTGFTENKRSLKHFFIKDKEYEYQNEFRFLWQRKDGVLLIDNAKDHIVLDIGYPLSGVVASIDELASEPFTFKAI